MKKLAAFLLVLGACNNQPEERYGFVARLGNDTVSVESVTRRGNVLASDEVDRFPRVRMRHTEISLNDDGSIRRLVMDIRSPSEPEKERERHVVAEVTKDSVLVTKRDGTGTKRRSFATAGGIAMAHLPQMYSLYDLYFGAALKHADVSKMNAGDTVRMRQFYIDREFDNFPLHRGFVRLQPGNQADIWHDWLSGMGQATFDSAHRMLTYSGARSTYKVDVTRLAEATGCEEHRRPVCCTRGEERRHVVAQCQGYRTSRDRQRDIHNRLFPSAHARTRVARKHHPL